MNQTIPVDLYEAGFLSQQQLNRSDIPVQYNSRMYPIIQFINTHFEKTSKPDPDVDSAWLMRIYSSAEGHRFTPGEFIAAMLSAGIPFERNGAGAVFGITKESVLKTEDKFSVQYATRLPKTYLHFPGRKAFNSLTLQNKASLIQDFMKYHASPKPYAQTYLLNKTDKMAILFVIDTTNKVIQAEALVYDEAISKLNLQHKTELVTAPEQAAF